MEQMELYDQYMMSTNGWFHIEESMSSQARKVYEPEEVEY
jgi:hypothetical protein